MRHGLADVVQERAALGDGRIEPELRGQRRGDVRRFHQMLQHVLTVARPVLESAEELDHLGVDVRDPDLRHRVLTGPADPLVDLGEGSLVDLLDPGGVDPSVLHQLLEREARSLPPDRIEAAEDHGLGGVVDDQVHAGRRLERPDVATLAADDPPLHVLARKREHADRGFRGLLGRDPLDRDRHDLPSALLPFLTRDLLYLADLRHGRALGVVDQRCEELFACLGRGHPGDAFELDPMLFGGLLEPGADLLQPLVPFGELEDALVQLSGPCPELILGLGDPALEASDLVPARLDVLLGVAPDL